MSVRSISELRASRRVATLVVAVGTLLLLLLISGVVNREASAAGPEPPPWPHPELDREWRWTPPGVEYEHMYRNRGDDSRRLDWIRKGR